MSVSLTTEVTMSNHPDLDSLHLAVDTPSQWLTSALSVSRTEGSLSVDGCDIRYFEWGDKAKPSIIMLHGFLAHSRCWAFIAPYLADDYHVVAFDMSGMGDSGWRADYSQQHRVNELMAVAKHTGLFSKATQPTIIAHSYGGRVATATISAYPDAFAGLIICDLMIIRPSVLKANADKFRPPGNQDPNRTNRIYPDYATAKQRFVLAPPQKVEQAELFDFMAYHSLKQVDGGWQWKFDPGVFQQTKDAKGSGNIEWGKIGEHVVKAPGRKVIIYGKDSLLFNADSVAYVNELVAEFEQATIPIIEIPLARHHLMLDQPIALLTALRSTLAHWAVDQE